MNLREAAVMIASDYPDQTTGRLRLGVYFCWTGALCDIYRLETGDGTWDEDGVFTLGEAHFDTGTPDAVNEYFNLSFGDVVALQDFNDNLMTMQELSDLVVEWYDGPGKQPLHLYMRDKRIEEEGG